MSPVEHPTRAAAAPAESTPQPETIAVVNQLCRLACDVDDAVQELERRSLTQAEHAVLAAPALHLHLALNRLAELAEVNGGGS